MEEWQAGQRNVRFVATLLWQLRDRPGQYTQLVDKIDPQALSNRIEHISLRTSPQVFPRQARPVEHQPVAVQPKHDRNIARGAVGPALRADVPSIPHAIARPYRAGSIPPSQRQRIHHQQRHSRAIAATGLRISRPAPSERLGGRSRSFEQETAARECEHRQYRDPHPLPRSLRSFAQ
jgi:hypothetical protein